MRPSTWSGQHALSARSAALLLGALLVLGGRAAGEDEPFAKRCDTGYAKALIHAGVCTVALRQTSFTYVTPYDCTAIVAAYRGQPLDGLPPEAVIARSLAARLQRDAGALLDCYDEASRPAVSRQFTEYLESDRAKVDDPAHATAALIGGAFAADLMYISFRFQDRTGATMLEWTEGLKRSGRGWRLTDQSLLNGFPITFSSACASALKAHGAIADEELARMTLFRILATPTIHAQLVQPQDLSEGDLAMAVLISTQAPPLRLDAANDALGDGGLLALCGARRIYAGADASRIGGLWLDGDPAIIPASPFAWAPGEPELQFCHGMIAGDACSIYLLGDGVEAMSDAFLCAKDGRWKLMDAAPADAADCGLWRLTGRTRLWSHMAELQRRRGQRP